VSDAALMVGRVASGDQDAWYRLGLALHHERRWGAAAGCFARAGGSVEALTNYGWNMHLSGRTEEALVALSAAHFSSPTEATPHVLLSQALGALGGDGASVEHARAGAKLAPESPIAHMVLAFALMLSGEWAEGWREYEWRFAYKLPQFRSRPYALWRGEQVDRLFVEVEQGAGDAIFAARWLKAARERCGELLLHVQPELYGLFAAAFGETAGMRILPLPRPLPDGVDAWCPMLSLPVALGASEPFDERTFGVSRICVGRDFSRDLAGFNIGICWQGSPEHENAHHRDCPLAYWLRLTEHPGVRVHSLQYRGTEMLAQLGAVGLIEDRAPEITNFLDAARVIEGLELVVTVDTATAHLAGAMGIPTWLLLNQRGQDFRWGRGETTGWYPSMRIWRRGLDEDWGALMARVDAALVELAA
jgi:hypothetical protein